MYHIYCDGNRITDNPQSYHHILTVLFANSGIDWRRLSSLSFDDSYHFNNYTFVRAV